MTEVLGSLHIVWRAMTAISLVALKDVKLMIPFLSKNDRGNSRWGRGPCASVVVHGISWQCMVCNRVDPSHDWIAVANEYLHNCLYGPECVLQRQWFRRTAPNDTFRAGAICSLQWSTKLIIMALLCWRRLCPGRRRMASLFSSSEAISAARNGSYDV